MTDATASASGPLNDDAAAELRAAADAFATSIRDSVEVLLDPNTGTKSSLDAAEGLRFVTRMISATIDMNIEFGDPSAPAFVRLMTPQRKFFGDNPDTYYDFAAIRGDGVYRIRGNRGTCSYLSFTVYGGKVGDSRIISAASDRDLNIADDGSFEIVLSKAKPSDEELGSATWLELDDDTLCVLSRQYFKLREQESDASYTIEAEPRVSPAPLTPTEIARRLGEASDIVLAATRLSALAATVVEKAPNRFSIASEGQAVAFFPTPDNQYVLGWYAFGEDEALVIEGTPPDTRYWAIEVMSRWMESLDFQHHRICLNDAQAEVNDDGSFRIVLAHSDPGVPNWLTTAGHPEGYMMFRWMQAPPGPSPECRVVKLADLK